MTKINFVVSDGSVSEFDAQNGDTVMEVATRNGVSGIEADCGGACACSTCHVYIDESWIDKLPDIEEMEKDMLEFAYSPDETTSRLTCQLTVTEDLNGLIVRMPEKQI